MYLLISVKITSKKELYENRNYRCHGAGISASSGAIGNKVEKLF